jgi:serine/threonine-protein kinase HipA
VTGFLGGYLPESAQRAAMAAKRQVAPDDLFALLGEFGGSVAGAVTLRRPGEAAPTRADYEALTDRALDAKLRQALREGDQGIVEDSRSTLPGFQPKVLVADLGGGWAYPHGRAHSTHILKPQVPSRLARVFDEHYSHLLAERVGLARFKSEIRTAQRTVYLAIERFDRFVADGAVGLVHQEDLAQVLGLDWRDANAKFQEPDWPTDPRRATARRIAEALGSIPGGDAAVEQWLRHLTYHVAIGNNDGHAKNVSLTHMADGSSVGDLYDAVPNLFQAGLISWNLALAIDGHFDHRRMSAERLLAEAASWGLLTQSRTEAVVRELLEALSEASSNLTPPPGVSAGMVEQVAWNISRLLAGSEISQPKRAL